MDASKPRQACVGCRRIKVACDNPQTGDACKRCVRLALACVYTKSQRGRRNDRLNARRSASPGRSSPATAATPSTRSWALDAARPRTSNLDMAELLDPEIPSASAPASAPGPVRARAPSVDAETRRMFEDPVDVGYVTLAEAHSLVKFFHDKLNPLIAILDPELHTLTFLRTSSILFTTLLVTASKYVLPERHSVLLAHAESLINRATNAGDCSTALIQSLLILVYYKGPTDRSAWLKIGIAIRLAFQLRWHETPPTLHLPADEAAARRILDPERTWFCLVCFDRQYADIFGLPPAIRATDYGDCEAWARAHAHLDIPVDIHLACSLATQQANEFWTRIRKEHESMPPRLTAVLLTDLYVQMERYRAKWFPRDSAPAPTHLAPARHLMEMFALSHQLTIKHHLLVLAAPGEADVVLTECVEHAARVVAALELVSADGSLPYLHDAGATTLSNFGVVMYKLFWRLEAHARPYIIEITARVRECCPPQGALAYTARFLDRVLGLFRAAVAEDAVPPAEAGLPDQSQLDEFLRLAGADMNELFDDDYWGNLLSSSLADPVYPALGPGL